MSINQGFSVHLHYMQVHLGLSLEEKKKWCCTSVIHLRRINIFYKDARVKLSQAHDIISCAQLITYNFTFFQVCMK